MKKACVLIVALVCVTMANASPLGTYIYDSFDGTAVDTTVWAVFGRAPGGPNKLGSVYVNTATHALTLTTGGDQYPGGMVQGKIVSVKPDAGQQVVLTSNKANFITDTQHTWGLMVPGGDGRYLGAGHDTDYILMTFRHDGFADVLELHIRDANGPEFVYQIERGINSGIGGGTPALVSGVFELHWGNGLVYLKRDDKVVFDSRVNGGSEYIPSVPLTAYAAASHSGFQKFMTLDDLRLEVATAVIPPLPPLGSDVNKDGRTDLKDFSAVGGNWGNTAFPAGVTPMAAGVYFYDKFHNDSNTVDPNIWDTHDSSLINNANGSVYLFNNLGIYCLIVTSGSNDGVTPGALITSKAAVHPEQTQEAVLSSSNVEYRITPYHCWGFMVPDGDNRAFGAMNNSDTDYILIFVNLPDGNDPMHNYTMEVRMRKDAGAVFSYVFRTGLNYEVSVDYGHTIHWSANRVYVVEEGNVIFDTAVNGGAASIPTVNMTAYAAASHTYTCLLFDDMKLELVEPAYPGDINRDRNVNVSDIAEIARNWLVSTL